MFTGWKEASEKQTDDFSKTMQLSLRHISWPQFGVPKNRNTLHFLFAFCRCCFGLLGM
jgi:hypothetical protein